MAAAMKKANLNAALQSSRWRRWMPAAMLSIALHVATVPGIVDYVSGRLEPGSLPPAPPPARLELEEERLRKPHETPRTVLEPQDELTVADSPLQPLPPPPDATLLPHVLRPQLAMSDIRFPESVFGNHLVSANTPTRPDGPARPATSPGDAAAEGIPDVTDTTPIAPIFPAEPPGSFLNGLPSTAVRLGETQTVFGDRSEEELRRRVYSSTYYPEAAADLELEGVVIVGFRVDGDGQPMDLSVTNPEMCHPLLQEEALTMVRSGAPYPIPESRREVGVTVALAYLNTPQSQAERVTMLLSSGVQEVDQHARQMAAQDAAQNEELGWHLALYRVAAKVTVRSGHKFSSPRLDAYSGDARLKRVFVESLPRLLPGDAQSARLKIPIQFRILDP